MIQPAAPDYPSTMFGVELKLINIIKKQVVGDMVTCYDNKFGTKYSKMDQVKFEEESL